MHTRKILHEHPKVSREHQKFVYVQAVQVAACAYPTHIMHALVLSSVHKMHSGKIILGLLILIFFSIIFIEA